MHANEGAKIGVTFQQLNRSFERTCTCMSHFTCFCLLWPPMRIYDRPLYFTRVLSFERRPRRSRTELDRTLLHVRKWSRFVKGRPKFGIPSPKTRGPKTSYFGVVYDDKLAQMSSEWNLLQTNRRFLQYEGSPKLFQNFVNIGLKKLNLLAVLTYRHCHRPTLRRYRDVSATRPVFGTKGAVDRLQGRRYLFALQVFSKSHPGISEKPTMFSQIV